MNQIKSKVLRQWLLMVFLALVTQSAPAYASLILADTAGVDNATTSDFYGVRNLSVDSLIESFAFDITADANAFFDFDGEGGFTGGTLVLGALTGLVPSDILSATFSMFIGGIVTHPAVIAFTFSPGSFGPGDAMRFSADTDFLVSDPAPGGVFGDGGAIFSVVFQSGQAGSIPFIKITDEVSVAPICAVCPIPVPPALLLLGSGLAGLFAFRRRSERV